MRNSIIAALLLILLAQTWLMATGRRAYHMQLGLVGYVLAALLVVVGFVLVPTIYHQVWQGTQMAPPPCPLPGPAAKPRSLRTQRKRDRPA